MPVLNSLQRKNLLAQIAQDKASAALVLKYVQTGDLSLDALPTQTQKQRDILAYVKDSLAKLPNPLEQQQWAALQPTLLEPASTEEQLLAQMQALEQYIRTWESSRPAQNHVDEARSLHHYLENKLREASALREQADWAAVDPMQCQDLLGHLRKYPHSAHLSEIDDNLWAAVNPERVGDIDAYLSHFPSGRHAAEASKLLSGIADWENVKATADIFQLAQYIENNPESPFRSAARAQLIRYKQQEKELMRTQPVAYDVMRLKELLAKGILSEAELIQSGVMTQNVLDSLRHTDIKRDLPDINTIIRDSAPECNEGYTDVFFFGIPSTGKTCVLMGLASCGALQINLASKGGNYAAALQQYIDVGVTLPPTPGSFVTTLEGRIFQQTPKGEVSHPVNLVEMSGEEFAFKITQNPEQTFSFADMGEGTPELLQGDNRKAFFLIIDPTTNIVHFNREVTDGYDEETGMPYTHVEHAVVNQQVLLTKVVNIFERPENASVMKLVDSLHIIVTKSDTLGQTSPERDQKALELFNKRYRDRILKPLQQLCREYNINAHLNFVPRLYTFSLGTFYVGGFYEYDPSDSDSLARAISNATRSRRTLSFWDKLRRAVN